jgi:hypothetical protein
MFTQTGLRYFLSCPPKTPPLNPFFSCKHFLAQYCVSALLISSREFKTQRSFGPEFVAFDSASAFLPPPEFWSALQSHPSVSGWSTPPAHSTSLSYNSRRLSLFAFCASFPVSHCTALKRSKPFCSAPLASLWRSFRSSISRTSWGLLAG